MKKSKLLIIISSILIAAGVVLGFVGYLMGASFNIVKDKDGFHVYEEGSLDKQTATFSQFKNIDISGTIEVVQIITSDKYAISTTSIKGKNEIKFSEENGKLIVESINEKAKSININIGNKKATNVVKIYLPQNADLDTININTHNAYIEFKGFNTKDISIKDRYGSIYMSDIKSESIETELSNGNTIIKNIESKNMNIENSYGSINVENGIFENLITSIKNGSTDIKDVKVNKESNLSNSYGSITIKDCVLNTLNSNVDNGNIKIGNTNAENTQISNTYGSLMSEGFNSKKTNITGKNSSIKLIGEFLGDTKIISNYGEVKVTTSVEKNLYNYDLYSNNGKIKVDEKGYEKSLKENNNAKNNLNIENNNGNITVDFQ